ncbi:MAG: Bifunctional phosphoglucose/phosphomannose isomerase [Candidatus Daviesbacteria bacterium GW2011_GWA2_38_24]|uniref:Bifunctional phosphoglucose/phosphomannose isomerase n=1 Tax=Candidatus Daviesbacteria bacterium GW2011_GWA2_38_24 TaxID=1618422 RepID=A0A0G0JCL7_9BACT|nr:MAG: Bifunctional phosphoglucose/phosphomannose isomerase [Candidatus Daviesbacteria bacterium GW2011_GWA2_38_24]
MTLDSQNMLQVLKNFSAQCKEALGLPKGISVPSDISNIVVIGMGGSAIGGDLLKAYLLGNGKVPVHVIRDYKVPKFVDENTLVFAVSYSGNTEETLSALKDAQSKNAKIIGVTSGGQLAAECNKLIAIPKGLQPRAALGYLFFPMLGVLHNSSIIRVKNEELNELVSVLNKFDSFNSLGETIAKKIRDKTPIIYSSESLGPVAMRWKTQINENAKMPAFYNVFSEMNHNEIAGYRGIGNNFTAVLIRDKHDNDRVKKRMDICRQIMEQRINVVEAETQGSSLLARMLSGIYLGDFVSYHLAMWNRIDPSPVEIIEAMKKKLAE